VASEYSTSGSAMAGVTEKVGVPTGMYHTTSLKTRRREPSGPTHQ
jgi:hypothetical protein